MIEIILEDLSDKTPIITNINIYKLYNMFKKGYLEARPQNDGASKYAKRNLPEICFNRSDMIPQKTGEVPSQGLKIGQLIKVELNLDNVLTLRGVKKPYPVSYGNANKEKALDTEARGEERIQVSKIPAEKKYMTILIPDNLFKPALRKVAFGFKDENDNIKKFMKEDEDEKRKFMNWIERGIKTGLIKKYKDTSRAAYYRAKNMKNPYELKEEYFPY